MSENKETWFSKAEQVSVEGTRRKPVSLVNVVPIMDYVLLKGTTKMTISELLVAGKTGVQNQVSLQVVGYGPDTRDIALGVNVEVNSSEYIRAIGIEGNTNQVEKLRDLYNELTPDERRKEMAEGKTVDVIVYWLTPCHNVLCAYKGEPTPKYVEKDITMPKTSKPNIVLS